MFNDFIPQCYLSALGLVATSDYVKFHKYGNPSKMQIS